MSIEEKLRELKNTYIAHLPDKIMEIQRLWDGLISDWQKDAFDELHRLIHSLAGSAGTFGFSHMGDVARSADKLLKDYRDSGARPGKSKNNEFELLLNKLSKLCTEISLTSKNDAISVELSLESSQESSVPIVGNRIFLVEDDEETAKELSLQIEAFGYDVSVFGQINDFINAMNDLSPAAVIMDIVFPEGQQAGIDAIREIQRQRVLHLPVIYISSSGDLKTRLNAVRSGGDAYLTKPIDVNLIVETLDVLTSFNANDQYRILIVDDDEYLSQHFATVLRHSGMDVMVVNQPFETMQALLDFDPELILMDIYMPECSGMELAKVIRQNISHINIPIVFLSNETDQEQQYAALRMGGDDYLTKPIEDNHLISSVITRVQRSRKLASAITRDSLTGLVNHAKIREQLEIEVLRAERQGTVVSFAMIDLDYFKSVNDTYGHVAGDHIIREISRVLKQKLRRTDIVGRYGGEEFAVIFNDTTEEDAAFALNKIREEFAQKTHFRNNEEFRVTFSAGVSGFTSHKNVEDIVKSADESLYLAKSKGRNCIVIANDKS